MAMTTNNSISVKPLLSGFVNGRPVLLMLTTN
jgi:hypothetical protein